LPKDVSVGGQPRHGDAGDQSKTCRQNDRRSTHQPYRFKLLVSPR
jgi:hypothetical protein